MNKTTTKYIAKYVFGELGGLRYSKNNLKIALEDDNYRIFDTRLSGYKFIEKRNKKIITSLYDSENKKYKDFKMTLDEFWRATRNRKNDILLIKLKYDYNFKLNLLMKRGVSMGINYFFARIFRKIFGRKIGKFLHFIFWLVFFDILIRPSILKITLVLNKVIKLSDERGVYLQSFISSNALSLHFWLDPHILPIVLVFLLAYLSTLVVPIILTLKARQVFKN